MVLIAALALGAVTVPVAARVARRFGVVDRPGPLKVQRAPVPYLGGAAVLLAAAPGLLAEPLLAVPLGLALAIGTADDARGLGAPTRLVAAALTGAVTALVLPGGLGVKTAAAVGVVVLVNAVNLLDGLDGLAGGVATASFAAFALLVGGDARSMALAFAGATVAFCAYNRPPARIYLGDGGAWVLGTALAACAGASWGRHGAAGAAAAILAVAVPLADTATAVVRRARARLPLFAGDRSHTYDRLTERGWPPGRVSAAFTGAQALLGGAAAALVLAPAPAAVAAVAVIAVLVAAALVRGGFVAPTYARGHS